MPTLNWIGKDAVVKHHQDVPFRLLEPVAELSVSFSTEPAIPRAPLAGEPAIPPSPLAGEGLGERGKNTHDNLIVQGDNLHALKALLPRYAGQVKCIYIDPPYNTGNEGWVYNDNVNSAEIRRWLGEVVGKEGETLDRHDRWLCMMYPRLVLLKQFLREDGAIFVSIDDNEVATLRLLMDEVFGGGNFITNLIWQKKYSPQNDARFFSEMHDHILVYSRNQNGWIRNLVPRTEKQDRAYKNPDNDHRGPWKASDLTRAEHRDRDFYGIKTPSGKLVFPASGRSWSRPPEEIERLRADGCLWFGVKGDAIPSLKRFLSEVKDGVVPTTIWVREDVGDNQEATQETKGILGERSFSTPKPYRLIQRILQIATDKDALVLDSFAGSGTTGHAVLKQNAEDGGNRRFILVEMDENIAQNVTAERVKRVAEGYTNAKGQVVDGLGGGFQFCRLSAEPLFTADGQIREDVTFAQLAEFVWFAETGRGLSPSPQPSPIKGEGDIESPPPGKGEGGTIASKAGSYGELEGESAAQFLPPSPLAGEGLGGRGLSPLLGIHEGRAIYLLYNGILKDKSVGGGNVLTGAVLDILPPFDGPKVIYAAANRLGARTARAGITFKQTPYALVV